jgi:hypothetical protein
MTRNEPPGLPRNPAPRRGSYGGRPHNKHAHNKLKIYPIAISFIITIYSHGLYFIISKAITININKCTQD